MWALSRDPKFGMPPAGLPPVSKWGTVSGQWTNAECPYVAEATLLKMRVHDPLGDLTYGVKTKLGVPCEFVMSTEDTCKSLVLFALRVEKVAGLCLLSALHIGQIERRFGF
jgi:hypothetical protein